MSEENQNNIRTSNYGISYNTTIAAAVATAVGGFVPAHAQEVRGGIDEITVTATKRGDMSIQDLAGSIQAFGTEAIRNQNLFSMEDYAKFTPSMSYFGNQSGAGKIFFRGIADAPDTFIASASAAVYLDEQPLTQSAQVDVRLIDIERVEALSGPQGTLFGSSSQSGTLRIVTNKPDPTKFESFADITLKSMEEGDPSYDISAMVNIPLVEDKFAIRLVGFSATEGGFIDNVLGTTANYEALGKAPVTGPQFNTAAVKENWNETTIDGARVGAKWFINDNWSATGLVSYQTATANAENTYDPTVGDLQLIAFHPDSRNDDWTAFAFTLDGAIGKLNFTSATAYFTRDSKYVQDTTSYIAYFG
ncbi:MAG: TonB-dependent receptor, partial [Chromatiales bacterium]